MKDLEAHDAGDNEPLQAPSQQSIGTTKALMPSSIITRSWRDIFRPDFPHIWSTPAAKSLRPTAYLDGLRGIAAVAVYVVHAVTWNHDVEEIQIGFGWQGNYSFITLPFLRVLFTSGHHAVAVFFVLSGFVISHRPLTLIHRQSDALYPALSSALFRRGIRLYVPFVSFTIALFTFWHIFGLKPDYPSPKETYLLEWQQWVTELLPYVNPFKRPDARWFSYDITLWTIPVEYQGSILCFSTLLAFSRISMRARVACTLSLALYLLHVGIWQMWLFLVGQVIADFYVLQTNAPSRLNFMNDGKGNRVPDILLLTLGLWLAGQPSGANRQIAIETPGWGWLASHVPRQYVEEDWIRFWLAIAAPLVLIGISNLACMRRVLESRVVQYLGRISFGLYLMHVPIGTTLGDTMFRMMGFIRPNTPPKVWDHWFTLPKWGPLGFEFDFLLAQALLLPVQLYGAELVMKVIDEPSVILGKRLYDAVVEW